MRLFHAAQKQAGPMPVTTWTPPSLRTVFSGSVPDRQSACGVRPAALTAVVAAVSSLSELSPVIPTAPMTVPSCVPYQYAAGNRDEPAAQGSGRR